MSKSVDDFTVPDGVLDGIVWKGDEVSVFVAARAGYVGPSHRWVDRGDFLTEREAGNGESHGTVYRLPAETGIVALLRAAIARVRSLETLIVSGTPDEFEFEAAQIAKATREEKV